MEIITRHAPWTPERSAAYTAMAHMADVYDAAHRAYHSNRDFENSAALAKAVDAAHESFLRAREAFSAISQKVISEFEDEQESLPA